VDYRSDPIVAVIQGEEGDHFIAEFFNRICRSLPLVIDTQASASRRKHVLQGQILTTAIWKLSLKF
jgi:hypothetical protein